MTVSGEFAKRIKQGIRIGRLNDQAAALARRTADRDTPFSDVPKCSSTRDGR